MFDTLITPRYHTVHYTRPVEVQRKRVVNVRNLEMRGFELEVCAEVQQQIQTAKIRLNTVCPQVDGLVSYGNDALMPDQAYSSAPMDTGVDGLSFIHPESFNQANTENHGRTHSH